jgi:hypothetical protein
MCLFEILLTLKKLQSHPKAEEGVSIGHFEERKDANLQTPTYIDIHHCLCSKAIPEHRPRQRAASTKSTPAHGNHHEGIGGPKRTPSKKKLDRLARYGRRNGLARVAIYSIHGHTQGSTSNRKDLSIPFISTHFASKLIIIIPS